MTGPPCDQDHRDRALDPQGSFHLTAPAGSGKTAVLLSRFLTLLAQAAESPQEVLTLTFTRKAAGDFRARAMKYLWQQSDPGPDAPPYERHLQELADRVVWHFDRHQWLEFLKVPERLPVSTFHSFCAQLLKVAPHEAGVPLEFQILESERDADWLKQEALEELRRRLSARPEADPVRQALVQRLVRLNNQWPRLAREMRDLLARRDTLKDFLALAQSSLEEKAYADLMEGRMSQVVAHDLKPLAADLADSELSRRWPEFVQGLRQQAAPLGERLPEQPPRAHRDDVPAWQWLAQALLTKGGDLRKQWPVKEGFPADFARGPWPGVLRELSADFLGRLGRYRDLPSEAFSPEEVAPLQDLILLLHAAWEVYEELCRQRRVLDFIAIEEAALRLLQAESPSDLLLRLDWRLRHVLVDEFQDTSDNQMELLCRLLSGWSPEDGRTLTVVGDPKQSIYGWRQARLRHFLESEHGLHCDGRRVLPLESLRLRTNFRATPTLITWVNLVFGGTVMADPDAAGGLVFAAADPEPGREGGEAPSLALFAGENREEARRREARWLAHRVAQVAPDLPPGEKAAVLLFTRNPLPLYLEAMQEAGLVPRVREGLKLAESRVVKHLHNLARALVRPQDDVAWAALLTGPWTQPDLASLAACARDAGEVWPVKLAAFAGMSQCPAEVALLSQRLLMVRERVGREPLADILERFLGEAAAWEGVAAWEGALGVASARLYLSLLADAEAGLPEATFQKADFALEEARQPPDPRAADSPVEVLTIHGAKGLEFHTVLLPFLDWQPLRMGGGQPDPFLLEEIPGTRAHVLGLAAPFWQAGQDASYRFIKGLRDARVLAEARRVFYVAVTRAQERLFLSGVLSARQGAWLPSPESPLHWLWRHYRAGEVAPGFQGTWPDPRLGVEIFPELPAVHRPRVAPKEPPPLWEILPEPFPYTLAFPSQEAAAGEEREYPVEGGPAGALDNLAARARGEVTHRLLETLARGGEIPGEPGVAAALLGLGLPRDLAQSLAPAILEEAQACLKDPFLKGLLAPAEAVSEWLLEDQPDPGIIRRGRLDLLAFDGEQWWVVDFKTSRPAADADWKDFLLQEREKYRPQLLAYRDMIAKAKSISPPAAVRLALYFTACRRVVEV